MTSHASLCPFLRGVILLLLLATSVQVVQADDGEKPKCWCDRVQPPLGENGTPNTTQETTTDSDRSTDLPLPTTDHHIPTSELPGLTTEQDRDPFPPGDVLNDPWLKKINFCFHCYSERQLQGLRNFWPYLYNMPALYWSDGQIIYLQRVLLKSGEIAVDPVLRTRLYCFISVYPLLKDRAMPCTPGNSTWFLELWNYSPIGMMRNNIPLSVLNATLAFLTLMLGIFGNVLIVVAILTKKELKSSTNLILLGMAVADCLNSMTIVFHGYLETFLHTITNPVLGPIGCAIVRTLKNFGQLAAVNHLIALSFERYFAICWPMKQNLKFTQKKTILIIIVNWIIAAVQTIPSIILKLPENINYADYMCHGTGLYAPWIFIVCDLTIYVVLPVPILCFNYVCVVRSLLTSIKRSREMTGDSSGQTQAEKARLRLTYMMVSLVVIYILTVTPGRVMDALKSYSIIGDGGIFYIKKVQGTVDMVRGINSWTNVVVYTLISRQFRTAFIEVLRGCWRKPSAGTPAPGNQNALGETPADTAENQV